MPGTDTASDAAEGLAYGSDGPWYRPPRRHGLLLAAIVLIALVRGLFWVATTEILNPIDEVQHLGYVVSVAEGDGPPTVGADLLQPDLVRLLKESETSWWRAVPRSIDPADPTWGAVTQQYEGVQPPAYYIAVAPAWWLASRSGVLTGVYAVRFASLLLSLLALPLTYLLARRVFPSHPAVWLSAPLVLALSYGFNANLTSVTNDALVLPVGAGLLLAGVHSFRSGLTWRNGLVTGAMAGLSMLTKPTMLGLIPAVGLLVVVGELARSGIHHDLRARIVPAIRWVAAAGAAASTLYGPWIAWNLRTYGASSPRAQVDAITGPLQPDLPLSLGALEHHLSTATQGFWAFQVLVPPYSAYELTFHVVTLVVGAAAAIAIWHRRRAVLDVILVSWAPAVALMLFAGMLAVIFVVFDGRSGVVGRHLYGAFPITAVALTGGAIVALGRRGGLVLLAGLAAIALASEPGLARAYLQAVYLADVLPNGQVPAAEVTWADGWVTGEDVVVQPPCETSTVALVTMEREAPSVLPLRDGGRATLREVHTLIGPRHFARYAVPTTAEPFTLELPDDLTIAASGIDRSPALRFAAHPGDPVAQVFCEVDDPLAVRFDQRADPQHPDVLNYGRVWAWFDLWRWLGALAAVATVAWAGRATWRERYSSSRRNLPV